VRSRLNTSNSMSVRSSESERARKVQDISGVGSLLGAPVSTELWDRLSGSPVLRSTTPSEVPSLCFERSDSVNDMEVDMSELSISGGESGGIILDSVIHVHELPSVFAYAYFERDAGVCILNSPGGTRVANSNPVVPRVVVSDAVLWLPLISSNGQTGHKFLLTKDGVVQAHIEVFLDNENASSLSRVLLVHGLYSNFAHVAKLIDKHSILEFNSIQSHIEKLYETMSSITEDAMYLPVNEVLVGLSLSPTSSDSLQASVPDQLASHPHASVVSMVWKDTKEQLHQLSSLVTNCIHQHNTFEFTRAGVM